MTRAYVVAATTSQFDHFKQLLVSSGDELAAGEVIRAHRFNWQGAPIKRIIVLPGGWASLAAEREAQVMRAYCARRGISLYNITEAKLASFEKLIEQEKANADSKD